LQYGLIICRNHSNQEGSEIKLSLEQDKIIVTKKENPKYTLKELLSKVTPDNIHKEVDFRSPKGKELL